MKGREGLINFLVLAALLGYVVSSILLFKEAFDIVGNEAQSPDLVLMNITSALTGLVGGIVAAAFGVEIKDPSDPDIPETQSRRSAKLQSMGAMTYSTTDENSKERMGNLYAWSYILVGLISVGIWLYLREEAPQNIANMGTTFIGMVIAIVSAYFRPTS